MRPAAFALIICGVILLAGAIWLGLHVRVWSESMISATPGWIATRTTYKNFIGTPVWKSAQFTSEISAEQIVREGPVNAYNQPHGRWTERARHKSGEWVETTTWFLNDQSVTEEEFLRY